MAKIVEPPKPKRIPCNSGGPAWTGCGATIEYLPEEVVQFGTAGLKVKCPREGCPGFGIISSGSID